MRTSSRFLVLLWLCALAPFSFAQDERGRGGERGGEQTQATVDQFGRPLTGQIAPELAPFDTLIPQLLQKYNIPGCTVAVMNNGQLVMSRGYGWADRDGKVPVSPDSSFRIGALSKPITSAAIMLLVQDGKLKLDTPVLNVLGDISPLEGATRDPRWAQITIRHLLQGSGGWDADLAFDPFSRLSQIATATKQQSPPDQNAIVRYMMGQPLQFDPGTKSVKSDFGYLLLGRVIEKVSGVGYEDFVGARLLTPFGATSFRLGATREQERGAEEVHYYDYNHAPSAVSAFDANAFLPRPDGAIALETRGSSDGWVCSAPDYLRFFAGIQGDKGLLLDSWTETVRRPSYALTSDTYYGLGWNVRPTKPFNPKKPGDHKPELYGSWWHEAALPGTSAFVARDPKGRAWVALFNSHPQEERAWSADLMSSLDNAIGQSQWPDPNAQVDGQNGDGNQ